MSYASATSNNFQLLYKTDQIIDEQTMQTKLCSTRLLLYMINVLSYKYYATT